MESTINNYKSRVFKRAYVIMKATSEKFSVCLSKAWQLYKLAKQMLSSEAVTFVFRKKDGTLRTALGTIDNEQTSNKVFTFFDLEAQGFRSFQVQSLITIK